jgi:hypothetical protein
LRPTGPGTADRRTRPGLAGRPPARGRLRGDVQDDLVLVARVRPGNPDRGCLRGYHRAGNALAARPQAPGSVIAHLPPPGYVDERVFRMTHLVDDGRVQDQAVRVDQGYRLDLDRGRGNVVIPVDRPPYRRVPRGYVIDGQAGRSGAVLRAFLDDSHGKRPGAWRRLEWRRPLPILRSSGWSLTCATPVCECTGRGCRVRTRRPRILAGRHQDLTDLGYLISARQTSAWARPGASTPDRQSRLGAGLCRDRARGACRVPVGGPAGEGDPAQPPTPGLPARFAVPSRHGDRGALSTLTGDDRGRKAFAGKKARQGGICQVK